MSATPQKRRTPRVPIACPVAVRDRGAAWTTFTENVGDRGCRVALPRPVAAGSMVQLRFDLAGGKPLDALGQVTWARTGKGAAAGIAFVSAPRDAGGAAARDWIDLLVAAQLRRALDACPTPSGDHAALREVVVQLGIPPVEALDRHEIALVRLARDGSPLAAFVRTPDALAVFVRLLEHGVLSVSRPPPDPEGWKRALSRLVDSAPAPMGNRGPGQRGHRLDWRR